MLAGSACWAHSAVLSPATSLSTHYGALHPHLGHPCLTACRRAEALRPALFSVARAPLFAPPRPPQPAVYCCATLPPPPCPLTIPPCVRVRLKWHSPPFTDLHASPLFSADPSPYPILSTLAAPPPHAPFGPLWPRGGGHPSTHSLTFILSCIPWRQPALPIHYSSSVCRCPPCFREICTFLPPNP